MLLVSGYDAGEGRIVLSVPPGVEPRRVSVDAIEHWMIYQARTPFVKIAFTFSVSASTGSSKRRSNSFSSRSCRRNVFSVSSFSSVRLVAAVAVAGTLLLTPLAATGASGDYLILGQENTATSPTDLTNVGDWPALNIWGGNSSGATLTVNNSSIGTAIRGIASSGYGVRGDTDGTANAIGVADSRTTPAAASAATSTPTAAPPWKLRPGPAPAWSSGAMGLIRR